MSTEVHLLGGLESTAVRLPPRSIQEGGNSGHLVVSLRTKRQYSPNCPYSCQRTMGLQQFSPFKAEADRAGLQHWKMSRPLSLALVLNQHVGCTARLCVLLETASTAFKHLQMGAIEEKAQLRSPFSQPRKHTGKRHKCLFDIIQSIVTR